MEKKPLSPVKGLNRHKGVSGVHPKRLTQLDNERRAAMRLKISDSNQLQMLLKDMDEVLRLRKEITKTTPALFERERKAKYDLLHNNLKISMDKRLALIAKVLADDKEIIVDDEGNQLPELRLTVVNKE